MCEERRASDPTGASARSFPLFFVFVKVDALLLVVEIGKERIKALGVFKTKFTEAFAPAQESRRHGFSIARFVANIIKQITEPTYSFARMNLSPL